MSEIVKFTPVQLQEEILKIKGWKEEDGPKTDYDGPCEWEVLLVPPGGIDNYVFPPKGKISRGFFYRGRDYYDFLNNRETALDLVEELASICPIGWWFAIEHPGGDCVRVGFADHATHSPGGTWKSCFYFAPFCIAVACAYVEKHRGFKVEVIEK